MQKTLADNRAGKVIGLVLFAPPLDAEANMRMSSLLASSIAFLTSSCELLDPSDRLMISTFLSIAHFIPYIKTFVGFLHLLRDFDLLTADILCASLGDDVYPLTTRPIYKSASGATCIIIPAICVP